MFIHPTFFLFTETEPEAEAPLDTQDDDVGESQERTQEPPKTPGRSSRSSSITTPTKTRSNPKIILSPLPEKPTTPTKSPIVEKTDESQAKAEALPDVSAETNKPQEEDKIETPEIHTPVIADTQELLKTLEQAVAETIAEEKEPKSEELVKEVEETEKLATVDEEAIRAEPIVQKEETLSSVPAVEENTDSKLTEEVPEMIQEPNESANATRVESIETETNAVENSIKESRDAVKIESNKTEVSEEDKDEKNVEPCIQDYETPDEPMDVKPSEVKAEVDENAAENALPSTENDHQDIEMKDPKDEPAEDSERDSKDRDRKDRRDRKRKRSSSPQDDRHKSPQPSHTEDEPDLKESEVVLSWYDSDLNLIINKESFLSATAMHNDGFGYVWAGARASYGFTTGKVYYEVKITECCEVHLPDEAAPHVLRCGWSVTNTSMQLGEEPLTYGYGGTGKISTGNKFSDYGEPFGKDDVVGCYLDMTDDNNIVISYTINGKNHGAAFTVPKTELEGKALFPHVLTKNCTFVCNFGQEAPWRSEILEGFAPVGSVELKDRVAGPRRPEKREDCEMIMMCGLPAAGKSYWAEKYATANPEKMYNVLGTNTLIEKMKVIGLPRRRNYHGRWEVLIDKCTRCLNKLLEMASTRRRNYILDQTNVYPSAQRRKMRNFYGYQRRAVVIVPTEEEFKNRIVKRTASEGEVVPEMAVLEMKANFSAPVVGESFDSIEWVELEEEDAKKLIEKYNKEGKDAGCGQQQSVKRPRFESRDNHRERESSRQNSRDSNSRDSRDHRDRRNNYPDRNRSSAWRGGTNSGGGSAWRDRQQRPIGGHGGHMRHSSGTGSGSGSGGGGYGGSGGQSGGWRGRGALGARPPSAYGSPSDRRGVAPHDRRTPGNDRNRSVSSRQGGWGPMR